MAEASLVSHAEVGPRGRTERYDRAALIYDPLRTELSAQAADLAAGGIAVRLADTADGLRRLALEQAHRLAALVVPGTLELGDLDGVLGEVTPSLWAGIGAVLVVAPRRERAYLRGLRDRGIRWALWDPYDGIELRFAVAATLATDDELDPRRALRVPVRLEAEVAARGATQIGVVRDLSLGGSYVTLAAPPPVGETVALAFALGERPFRAEGVVAHCRTAPAPGAREPGIGVAFRPLPAAEHRPLEAFLRERIGAFRL
jgi:hypothetical protein